MTTTDGEQPDDSFDLMDIPSEMSPPAATSSIGGGESSSSSEPILPAVGGVSSSSSPVPPPSSLIEYSLIAPPNEKGHKTGSSFSPIDDDDDDDDDDATTRLPRSERLSIGCLDIRASSVSNLLDETDAPPVDATPIIIHGTVNNNDTTVGGGGGKVSSVSGRTPPLPDLRATDFFRYFNIPSFSYFLFPVSFVRIIFVRFRTAYIRCSTPVRGSVDAGQPVDTDDVNSTLTLIASGRGRGGGGGGGGEEGNGEKLQRVVNNMDEKKHGDGKRNVVVNVTTNPLDISLIGSRTDRSNKTAGQQSSDGTTASKPRGKPAGKWKLSSWTYNAYNAYPLLRCFHIFDQSRVFRRRVCICTLTCCKNETRNYTRGRNI